MSMKRILVLVAALTIALLASSQVFAFQQAPMLAELVKAGKLPPVEERLPQDVAVVEPVEEVGEYGGTWSRSTPSVGGALSSRVLYDPLVRWDYEGNEVVPNVAKSWDVSADGSTFTFHLRKGMKWSDGATFDADSIMWWYDHVLMNKELTPAVPSWLTVGGEPVKVEKIDQYTVRFTFADSYGLFLRMLAFSGDGLYLPGHYLEQFHADFVDTAELDKAVKAAGFDSWTQFYGAKNSYTENTDRPVITAWQMSQRSPDQVIAVRNPYYWKVDPAGNQLPYIDRIVGSIVSDEEIIQLRASSGETDFEYQYLRFSNIPLFQQGAQNGDYRVLLWQSGETAITLFPNLNMQGDDVMNKILNDRRFRLALSLAVNRDEINELIYFGMAEPAWKVFLHESEWDKPVSELEKKYADLVSLYQYDPERANKLLDEMGLDKRNNQGYRLRPDGKVLSLLIQPYDGGLVNVKGFEIVKDYLEQVGIKTSVDPLSGQLWWPTIYASEYQMVGYLDTRVAWQVYPRDWAPLRNHTYWAPLWGLHYDTGGQSGLEPPADIKAVQDKYDRIMSTTDQAEFDRLSTELLLEHGKQLWSIPMGGLIPLPDVAKNNFRNVPETGYMVWSLKTPGYVHPEQFFIRQ